MLQARVTDEVLDRKIEYSKMKSGESQRAREEAKAAMNRRTPHDGGSVSIKPSTVFVHCRSQGRAIANWRRAEGQGTDVMLETNNNGRFYHVSKAKRDKDLSRRPAEAEVLRTKIESDRPRLTRDDMLAIRSARKVADASNRN